MCRDCGRVRPLGHNTTRRSLRTWAAEHRTMAILKRTRCIGPDSCSHVVLSCRFMPEQLPPGQKAARTRKRRAAAAKAVQTKRRMSAFAKARAAEAASKEALRIYCQGHGWKIAFFEGATGAPRTGIIDAVMFRFGRKNADALDVRLIQLKGGKAGLSGPEIARLKKAVDAASVKWLIAAFDGEELHVVPDDPRFEACQARLETFTRVSISRS